MRRGPGSVRLGLGLGVGRLVEGRRDLAEVVDALEATGFDSLWASDVLGSYAPDPIGALAFAAARTTRLKLGTSVLPVPGHVPARLAKQLATLDLLSDGRMFPGFGLGTADPDALDALTVERGNRGPITEEMIPLLRRLWAEEEVTHEGRFFRLNEYRPHLHPTRRGLSVWFGGQSRAELRRAGRLADGWLASFATPEEVRLSIPVVRGAAREAGRSIPEDHFGVLLLYAADGLDDDLRSFALWRRPGVEPADYLPSSTEELAALVARHISAGATKFILVPARRPACWSRAIEDLAATVASLEPEAPLS